MRKAIAFALLGLAGCGSIQKYRTVEQQTGAELTAGVGDTLVTVQKQRSLKNIYGGADIWGRRTDEGASELKFAGMPNPNIVEFFRYDVEIYSNETTGTRMGGLFIPNNTTTRTTGTVGSTPFAMKSTTQGLAFVPAPQASSTALPSGAMRIDVDLQTTRRFAFEGQTVEILDASPMGITYRIEP